MRARRGLVPAAVAAFCTSISFPDEQRRRGAKTRANESREERKADSTHKRNLASSRKTSQASQGQVTDPFPPGLLQPRKSESDHTEPRLQHNMRGSSSPALVRDPPLVPMLAPTCCLCLLSLTLGLPSGLLTGMASPG